MFGLIPSILSNIPSRSSSLILIENSRTHSWTIHYVFTFSWKYSSRPWRFQWPVSRKAVLFHEFISAVNSKLFQLSSGTHNHPDNVLIQGDNMYLNAFNNDLIPREGFLSLKNLPTVVCCRQVLRLFMSTGLYIFCPSLKNYRCSSEWIVSSIVRFNFQ